MSFLNDWVASQYMGTGDILDEYKHREEMDALQARVKSHRESALSWKRYAQELEQQVKDWQQDGADRGLVSADKHYHLHGWRFTVCSYCQRYGAESRGMGSKRTG